MIYLDYAATTPCDPEVVDAMLPFFTEKFANASSVDHLPGSHARSAVETARESVARLVDANPEDVIFTSGSTEANNLVLSLDGLALTSAVEHPSVLEPAKHRPGNAVRVIGVTSSGLVDEAEFREALAESAPSIVSLMHTNNETGAQNDIQRLAAIAHDHGSLFHSDATQGALLDNISLRTSAVDAVSLSAHKIYGPKGVGALICRPQLRRKLSGLTLGGGHERGLRSGTLNVPGIVGFGAAAQIAFLRKSEWRNHFINLADTMFTGIADLFSGQVRRNGPKLANSHILSVQIEGVNNRALLRSTAAHIAFALGSACATTKSEPSYVLRAMGLSVDECNQSIRLSFGSLTTRDAVDEAARTIADAANDLLAMVA